MVYEFDFHIQLCERKNDTENTTETNDILFAKPVSATAGRSFSLLRRLPGIVAPLSLVTLTTVVTSLAVVLAMVLKTFPGTLATVAVVLRLTLVGAVVTATVVVVALVIAVTAFTVAAVVEHFTLAAGKQSK